jgi:hypothetical protein
VYVVHKAQMVYDFFMLDVTIVDYLKSLGIEYRYQVKSSYKTLQNKNITLNKLTPMMKGVMEKNPTLYW